MFELQATDEFIAQLKTDEYFKQITRRDSSNRLIKYWVYVNDHNKELILVPKVMRKEVIEAIHSMPEKKVQLD